MIKGISVSAENRKFLLLIFLSYFLNNISLSAQSERRHFRQHEIGLLGGISYYIGDINPFFHSRFPRPAGTFFYRFCPHYRYAFRFGFSAGMLYANDRDFSNAVQQERNLNFRSPVYECAAQAEFNFVEYRLGHPKHIMSFYTFLGLGGFYFHPKGNIGNGWKSLPELKTEGVSYSLFQICIPFGIGFKWSVTENIGFHVEWGPRKTFTDYLDDVSTNYPLDLGLGKDASVRDLYSFRSPVIYDARGTMRGNPRTKDWYFIYGFGINIRLPSREGPCHGMSF